MVSRSFGLSLEETTTVSALMSLTMVLSRTSTPIDSSCACALADRSRGRCMRMRSAASIRMTRTFVGSMRRKSCFMT